jgi:hypothetical protein
MESYDFSGKLGVLSFSSKRLFLNIIPLGVDLHLKLTHGSKLNANQHTAILPLKWATSPYKFLRYLAQTSVQINN